MFVLVTCYSSLVTKISASERFSATRAQGFFSATVEKSFQDQYKINFVYFYLINIILTCF